MSSVVSFVPSGQEQLYPEFVTVHVLFPMHGLLWHASATTHVYPLPWNPSLHLHVLKSKQLAFAWHRLGRIHPLISTNIEIAIATIYLVSAQQHTCCSSSYSRTALGQVSGLKDVFSSNSVVANQYDHSKSGNAINYKRLIKFDLQNIDASLEYSEICKPYWPRVFGILWC